jgi:hypothetical protein
MAPAALPAQQGVCDDSRTGRNNSLGIIPIEIIPRQAASFFRKSQASPDLGTGWSDHDRLAFLQGISGRGADGKPYGIACRHWDWRGNACPDERAHSHSNADPIANRDYRDKRANRDPLANRDKHAHPGAALAGSGGWFCQRRGNQQYCRGLG